MDPKRTETRLYLRFSEGSGNQVGDRGVMGKREIKWFQLRAAEIQEFV